jgi:phosphate butyryltransferase
MPLASFDELFRIADARAPGLVVAAAGGADRTVLEALRAACDRGWVSPLLVGPESEIRAIADQFDVSLEGFEVLDVPEDSVARSAVEAVRSGRAALLMKGRVSTPTLLRAVLDPLSGLRTGRVVCQVVLMEIVRDARRFLLADTGITIRPDLAAKADILSSTCEVARSLGEPSPRVALMAATESPTPAMPETLEAADLQKRAESGEFPGCLIQGPLSFDLAYAADAADRKRIGGPVVGAADAMVFPDLASANLTVKAIMYTADCRFGGILKGTSAPVVFMSRADSTETRLRSLALALGSSASDRV